MTPRLAALTAAALLCWGVPARAQSPPPAVEGAVGYTGFGDEGIVHHWMAGAAARVFLTPRLALGGGLDYMNGPDRDRDLVLTGNFTADFLRPRGDRPRRVAPYVTVAGGILLHSMAGGYGGVQGYSRGHLSYGFGARIAITPRLYVAPEARMGYEPHVRATMAIGWRPGPR